MKPIKIVHKWWWKLLFAFAKKKENKKNICSYVVVAMLKVRVFKRNVDINWITFTLGKTVLRLNDATN